MENFVKQQINLLKNMIDTEHVCYVYVDIFYFIVTGK